jgi:hypothetical protein
MNKPEGFKDSSCYALTTYPVALSVKNACKWNDEVYFGADSSGASYLSNQPPTAPDFYGRIGAGTFFRVT